MHHRVIYARIEREIWTLSRHDVEAALKDYVSKTWPGRVSAPLTAEVETDDDGNLMGATVTWVNETPEETTG